MGIGTHITQSTTKVTPFNQLEQLTHLNTNPPTGTAISPGQLQPWAAVSALIIRPHQYGIVDGQEHD